MLNVPEFLEWLRRELDKREMNQADFAKAGGISTAFVSRVLSGAQLPGLEFYEGTARAFKLPISLVIGIAAGEFPFEEDLKFNEIVERLRRVDPATRELIYDLVVLRSQSGPRAGEGASGAGGAPKSGGRSARGKETRTRGAASV